MQYFLCAKHSWILYIQYWFDPQDVSIKPKEELEYLNIK